MEIYVKGFVNPCCCGTADSPSCCMQCSYVCGKQFSARIMKEKAAERPDAPVGRKDVNVKHSELQMITHSLLFNRQWEWNPVSLRSTGWPSETKTWHQKSQVIAWLGTCGTYSCCVQKHRVAEGDWGLHYYDTFWLSEYLLNTISRTVV